MIGCILIAFQLCQPGYAAPAYAAPAYYPAPQYYAPAPAYYPAPVAAYPAYGYGYGVPFAVNLSFGGHRHGHRW